MRQAGQARLDAAPRRPQTPLDDFLAHVVTVDDTPRTRRGALGAIATGTLLAWLPHGASCAEPYPAREVTLVVPFPPGGVTDLTARVLARHLSALWRQPVTVVDVAGLGGTTGTMQVLGAAADGYTMLMSATGQATQNPALDSRLPYRWDTPSQVARVTVSPLVFVVRGDSPWHTLQAAMDAVALDPGRYRYGTSGTGGVGSIALAQLLAAAGVDPSRVGRVALEGGAPLLDAVIDGHTDFAAQYQSEMREPIAAGRLRPLAVSTTARTPPLPDVPTAREAGFPAFSLIGWTGIAGPAALPQQVVTRWNDALRALVGKASFQREIDALGGLPGYLDAAAFKTFLEADYLSARRSAEALGLRR